jgi:hypothetical protein
MTKFYLDASNPSGAIRDLNAGLDKLNFEDNFQGFVWEGTLTPSQELSIQNKLRSGQPTSFQVLFITGANTLVAGDTEWNPQRVSLKNYGAASLTARVYFYR